MTSSCPEMRARAAVLLVLCAAGLLLAGCGVGLPRLAQFFAPGSAPVTGLQPTIGPSTVEDPMQPIHPTAIETAAGARTPPPVDGTLAAASTPPGGPPRLVAQTEEESSETPRYEFSARYPALEWGADPRVEDFNGAAEEFVRGQKHAFAESLRQMADALAVEGISSLEIDFTPSNVDEGLISVMFRVYYYSAGAAHPGSYHHGLNYDLRSGRVLALDDLFTPGSRYLEVISKACIADLNRRGVLEWEEGAAPQPENYQVWNITPEGMLVIFDEYQVASYAAGPQSVVVPYSTLRPLLRPDGPLGRQAQ